MLSLDFPHTDGFLSLEQSTFPTPFRTAPSSPKWKLDRQASQLPDSSTFKQWKDVMSSSQDFMADESVGHHEAKSSSFTGSDFEFDLGDGDVADPPVSPKLVHPMAPAFMYSDFWTDDQVFTRSVPALAPLPRRFTAAQSVRELLAADDASSSCSSYLESPRSQRPDVQTGRHIVAQAVQVKSRGAITEEKTKSSPDKRKVQHSPRPRRVHHADDDSISSSRRSNSHLSMLDSSSSDEDSKIAKHNEAGQAHHSKRWTLKYLLPSSKRSSYSESKTQNMENSVLRTSKSTPARSPPRSPKLSSRPMSPHEAHYKNQRAQWDEMKMKTTLPFKQGLLGCLGGPVFAGTSPYRAVL